MPWQVQIAEPALADLRRILRFTRDRFDARQATIYRTTILAALAELREGPEVAGGIRRDAIQPGLRSLHVARLGRRGRHLLVYRIAKPEIIEILRILHDAMDLPRHLPPNP